MKKFILILAAIIMITLIPGNHWYKAQNTTNDDELVVYTTVYALQTVTSEIVGDVGTVYSIYPPGSEAHDYELTVGDMIDLNNADLFVYMDNNFEPNMTSSTAIINPDVAVIEANQSAEFMNAVNPQDLNSQGEPINLHTMLYPPYMAAIADSITNELCYIDQPDCDIFRTNNDALQQELVAVDAAWQAIPSDITIYTTHDAYYYWDEYYPITVLSIHNGSNDNEATMNTIQTMIDSMEAHHVQYFYGEAGEEPDDVALEIMDATNTDLLTLNTMEIALPASSDESYQAIMMDNLAQVYLSLGDEND